MATKKRKKAQKTESFSATLGAFLWAQWIVAACCVGGMARDYANVPSPCFRNRLRRGREIDERGTEEQRTFRRR
jgi:hypothetical protein